MDTFDEGLRCQDVHSGLRNLDPNSPALGPLNDTRIVGMAATLAGLIRGRDVIEDSAALMQVAAHQLDVHMLSYGEVIALLEDAGYVQGVKRAGGKILSFTETVPFYDDLYATLGDAWRARTPTELEQQMLVVLHGLSVAPVALDTLESKFSLDHAAIPDLLEVGESSGLVRRLRTLDGDDLVYSPFFGFEDPAGLESLVLSHGSDRLIEEFAAVRERQGLELDQAKYPLLTEAVAAGLVMAPSVRLPDGDQRAYVAMPYVADQQLLTTRKPVIDKALAVLACLRSAERYAEYNTLSPHALVAVIDKLLDPNRGFLRPNSAHRRQYELLRNAGLILFGADTRPNGSWVTPIFVDTADNREALTLARDLIVHGEMLQTRVDDQDARAALSEGKGYRAPMQTTDRLRKVVTTSAQHFEAVFAKAMGRSAL